jgi:hypothetical protein
LDLESLKDPQWLKKVRYRIGYIVMEFNYLERQIDEIILGIMNSRAEDERVWIFLESFSADKKIDTLSKLYDNYFTEVKFDEQFKEKKKILFQTLNEIRVNRNIYIHANWMNEFNGDLVEWKTKKVKSGEYGRVHKRISIADLDEDLNRIMNMQVKLYEFHEEITQKFFSSF